MGSRKNQVRAYQKELTKERVAIELRFGDQLEVDDELQREVTHRDSATEPHHRWFPYRQGFSFELVRRFLSTSKFLTNAPILDSFSGSGTVAIEAARQGVAAIGIDSMGSLGFLAAARFAQEPRQAFLPSPHSGTTFDELFRLAEGHFLQAAVLIGLASTLDGEGRKKSNAESPAECVARVLRPMIEDLRREPLPRVAHFVQSDARHLPLAAASCGGLLTSPPYISRYDYAKKNAPLELLHSGRGRGLNRAHQIRASKATAGRGAPVNHPATQEAIDRLREEGHSKEAAMVAGYFADLSKVLKEWHRVLKPGAPAWVVIAGADVKREYIPSDFIFAEMATEAGFTLDRILEARRLRPQGRNLGGIRHVAPRESLVILRN
jgi:tRNA G10  N-methylase Trm11